MKILKQFFFGVIALFLVLIVVISSIFLIDDYNTSYLKIKSKNHLKNNNYIIKNVHVIPMTSDTILKNHMVYVKDGKIAKIAKLISVSNITEIDGEKGYLMPGLIDMHVHVWDYYELGLYLANSITSVRNVWGIPMHLRMKKAITNNKIIAPLLYTTGPKLTGATYIGDDNLNLTSGKEAQEKILTYKNKDYDFIKTYYGLPKPIFDSIITQASISNIDIVAHPSQKVPFTYHLNPQIKSIEHVEEIVQQPLNFHLDTLKLKPIIGDISNYKSTNYCPTLTVFNNIYKMMLNDHILSSEMLGYMNPLIKKVDSKKQFQRWYNEKLKDSNTVSRIRDQHKFHITIVSELHKANVPIICGTDAGIGITLPGFSIHKELAFYKKAGMSNYNVLKTATINAANTHKMMSHMGSIEVNKTANLIVLNQNPLKNLSTLKQPKMVMVNGRVLTAKNLNEFKNKAKKRNNFLVTGLRYAEYLIFVK